MFETGKSYVKFKVDRRTYSEKALKKTLSVFRPRFKVSVTEKENRYTVEIEAIPPEASCEKVAYEFYNFLLKHEKSPIIA